MADFFERIEGATKNMVGKGKPFLFFGFHLTKFSRTLDKQGVYSVFYL
jgi:hypothetical protein